MTLEGPISAGGPTSVSLDAFFKEDLGLHPSRRVGIFTNTPGQVHFYRHIYQELIRRGHSAFIIARDYGETLDLLKEFELPHQVYSVSPSSKMGKVFSLPKDVINAASSLKKNRVDIITGFGVYDAFASALLGVPNIIFTDIEPWMGRGAFGLQYKLYSPFVDSFLTPHYFKEDLGERHIRINGIKEMAYLHPNRFRPDESVLDALEVGKGERYSILRFNSLDAFHDLRVGGFSIKDQKILVRELEKFGRVFISSEKSVPPELENRVIRVPKCRIHHMLYYASLLVTDTGTMATEAALLGTPTVRCSSYVGTSDLGNFIELEERYHVLYNFMHADGAIAKSIDLLKDTKIKGEWKRRSEKLCSDNIDVSSLMTWCIENYPESVADLKRDPKVQERFR